VKRIVIKVGSHVLTQNGELACDRLKALVALLAKLHGAGIEVILVSSGAVAAGYTKVELNRSNIAQKQALAAVGQPYLLSKYQKEFDKFNIITAQVLLTADGFDSRKVTAHAKCAIEAMLEQKILPIVNENDVTATEELLFGDNDRLSAHVTHYFNAELLVILSDIDAYYTSDPRVDSTAVPRKVVNTITKDELQAKHTPNNEFATGGIVTKLEAANFLMQRGKKMFLSSGFNLDDVTAFLIDGLHNGGTLFQKGNND